MLSTSNVSHRNAPEPENLSCVAGACFGLYWGVLLVYVANVVGQTLAFLLARSYLHGPLTTLVTSYWPQFPSIDAALRREGWRLVFVLRLSPCVPFAVLNYALGLTGISLLEYSASSAVAIVPFVVISVYLGLASGTALSLLDSSHWRPRASRPGDSAAQRAPHRGQAGIAELLHALPGAPATPRGPLSHSGAQVAAATGESTGLYHSEVPPGLQGSSAAITITTVVLAIATGVYAVWFIRRVTSEVLEDEPGGGLGGAEGGCEGARAAPPGGAAAAGGAPANAFECQLSARQKLCHLVASPGGGVQGAAGGLLAARAEPQSSHGPKSKHKSSRAASPTCLRAAGGEGGTPFVVVAAPGGSPGHASGPLSHLEAARHAADGEGGGLHAARMHVQQRWPRWTGRFASNVARAARSAMRGLGGARGEPSAS